VRRADSDLGPVNDLREINRHGKIHTCGAHDMNHGTRRIGAPDPRSVRRLSRRFKIRDNTVVTEISWNQPPVKQAEQLTGKACCACSCHPGRPRRADTISSIFRQQEGGDGIDWSDCDGRRLKGRSRRRSYGGGGSGGWSWGSWSTPSAGDLLVRSKGLTVRQCLRRAQASPRQQPVLQYFLRGPVLSF